MSELAVKVCRHGHAVIVITSKTPDEIVAGQWGKCCRVDSEWTTLHQFAMTAQKWEHLIEQAEISIAEIEEE